MRRNRSGILSFGFLLVMVLILAVGSFFTPGVESTWNSAWLCGIVGMLCLGCIGVSLYYINDSFFLVSKDSSILPMIYLLLVFSYPQAVYFSYYHVAALLFLWGLYYNVRLAVEEDKKINSLFLSTLLFSSVILIVPQFIWFVAIVFFTNITASKMNFFRYLPVCLAGFLMPFLYYFSIQYLFFDFSFCEFSDTFTSALTTMSFDFGQIKIGFIFMIGMIVILALRSFFFIMRHKSDFSTSSSKSFSRGFYLAVIVLIIYFIYFSSINPMIQLIVYIPVSVMIFAFLTNVEKKTEASLSLTLLLLSIFVGRISFFL